MPSRRLPNSEPGRIKALDSAFHKWTATEEAALRLITEAHYAQLDDKNPQSLRLRLHKAIDAAGHALSEQTELRVQVNRVSVDLAHVTSHFIQTFNMAVERRVFKASDRAYYRLAVNSPEMPPMKAGDDLNLWAQRLIDGEAARLNAAPPSQVKPIAMAMPSAGEIEGLLNDYRAIRALYSTAKDHTQRAQMEIERLRHESDRLIKDMWDTIEFNLRNHDPATIRRIAREWGIVYLNDTTEEESVSMPPTSTVAETEPEITFNGDGTRATQPGAPRL